MNDYSSPFENLGTTPLNPEQMDNIHRLRAACLELDHQHKGFSYPNGTYDNLSSVIGNANFVMGHYLYLFGVDSILARIVMSAAMNVPPMSEQEYDQMILHCHQVFSHKMEFCLETFDALADIDKQEMQRNTDVSSYIPLVCIYADIMQSSVYTALALTGEEEQYESKVDGEMDDYINALLVRAYSRIPNLTDTKPFEAVYDA